MWPTPRSNFPPFQHHPNLCLSIVADILTALTVRPENKAAIAGDSVILSCSGQSSTIIWAEYITTSSETFISVGESMSDPPNREIYQIINPSVGTYNLHIHLLATSGGRYKCQELLPQDNAYVNIIVMGEWLY